MSSLDLGVSAPEAFADSVRSAALDAARLIEDPRRRATALTRIVRKGAASGGETETVAGEAFSAALEVDDPLARASALLELGGF